MDKPWKVILAFTGIFVAGILGGALLGVRYARQLQPPPSRQGLSQNFGPQMMKRFTEQLELTPAQTAQITPIVEKAQTQVQLQRKNHMRELTQTMDAMHSEISAVLTPEQRVKLEELRKKFLERSERLRRESRGAERDRPPPPPK